MDRLRRRLTLVSQRNEDQGVDHRWESTLRFWVASDVEASGVLEPIVVETHVFMKARVRVYSHNIRKYLRIEFH